MDNKEGRVDIKEYYFYFVILYYQRYIEEMQRLKVLSISFAIQSIILLFFYRFDYRKIICIIPYPMQVK